MAYWLLKSEPSTWSWAHMVKAGTTRWDGVRNHQAAANLKAMKKGDIGFFYHSNVGKEIVGMVEIVREAYPDPSDAAKIFVCVDVRAGKAFRTPVSLAAIKADPTLKNMALVRQSRLSVCPVSAAEAARLIALGGAR